MENTKMFYTQNELKNITKEELLELTTFGGSTDTFYYVDVENVSIVDNEMCISFKNGEKVFTDSQETFDDVKLGKARYELLAKSLEANKEQDNRENVFYAKTQTHFESLIIDLNQRHDIQVKKLMEQNASQAESQRNTTKNLELTIESSIKKMEQMVETSAKNWDKKVKELDYFDTEAYEVKMKKVDNIISAFAKLLED